MGLFEKLEYVIEELYEKRKISDAKYVSMFRNYLACVGCSFKKPIYNEDNLIKGITILSDILERSWWGRNYENS